MGKKTTTKIRRIKIVGNGDNNNNDHPVEIHQNDHDSPTLLEGLNASKTPINQSCGGMGSCGTCRVIIKKSSAPLPPRTCVEQDMAEDRKFKDDERLACQLSVDCDLEIIIPKT